jgi:hypothetical protein
VRRALLLIVLLVGFGAPACSGDDDGASAVTTSTSVAPTSVTPSDPEVAAFCDRLVELDEAGRDEQVDTTDLEDLDRLYDQLDEVAEIAPAEVADDLRLIADGQRFLATGLGEGESLPESIEEAGAERLDEALDEAYGHVREYLAAECGIAAAPN